MAQDNKVLADTLRMLAVDVAEGLRLDYLRYNPADPVWPGRNRFVLSNGHWSMLQYGLLHLTGYDLQKSRPASRS